MSPLLATTSIHSVSLLRNCVSTCSRSDDGGATVQYSATRIVRRSGFNNHVTVVRLCGFKFAATSSPEHDRICILVIHTCTSSGQAEVASVIGKVPTGPSKWTILIEKDFETRPAAGTTRNPEARFSELQTRLLFQPRTDARISL